MTSRPATTVAIHGNLAVAAEDVRQVFVQPAAAAATRDGDLPCRSNSTGTKALLLLVIRWLTRDSYGYYLSTA